MDRIALASELNRRAIFIDVAHATNLDGYIIEKDFWVSWVLGKIFADETLSKVLCFKGGTSLSKAFGIIERFSEDIDLILALSEILKPDEDLVQESNTKQAAFNAILEERASIYINSTLKNKINEVLQNVCQVRSDEDDTHVLHIVFPRVFEYEYIQPSIKLEIGPLALWNPNEKNPITSFVGKYLPELNLANPEVPTVKAERTFWEKLTILHHEHHRPTNSNTPVRYSRHYYDVFKLGHTDIKQKAFANLDLLNEVVEFKKRFYPRGWAKYDEAKPGTMRLVPPEHCMQILKDDYEKMRQMIYGDAPNWEEIIDYLAELEQEINNL